MGGTEVSSSVSAIVETFLRCCEVLQKIKSKAKGKKAKKQSLQDSESEARLHTSLAWAPPAINAEYARGLQALGRPFAWGDVFAQTLLQTTLVTLNKGLVDLISAFLVNKDPSKLHLDYKALAALSDASCSEARDTLIQLGRRLSRSTLSLQPRELCGRCGASGRHACASNTNRGRISQSAEPASARRAMQSKEYVAGVRHANKTQWAVVRTRPAPLKKRAASSSSTSSSSCGSNVSSNSAASLSTNATTLCGTPPPQSPPIRNTARRQPPPPRPQSQPQMLTKPPTPLLLRAEHLAHIPPLQKPTFTCNPITSPNNGPTAREQANHSHADRRRQERTTDSIYSFASDSTKIGEIPMHKWAAPYDYVEMARLNAEAAAADSVWTAENMPAGPAGSGGPGKAGRKWGRGFFAKVLRIAPLDPIQEA